MQFSLVLLNGLDKLFKAKQGISRFAPLERTRDPAVVDNFVGISADRPSTMGQLISNDPNAIGLCQPSNVGKVRISTRGNKFH